jgi:ethanolamine utilization protein EutA
VEAGAESIVDVIRTATESQSTSDAEFWFSGGVAEIIFRLRAGEDVPDTEYGDCGVLLARALIHALETSGIQYHVPPNPIRATVIGAGAHSLQLSGSTVAISNSELPIRNLQIVRVANVDQLTIAMQVHDLDWSQQTAAIYLRELPRLGYVELKKLAQKLAIEFKLAEAVGPLVVLMQQDMAAALGQLLITELPLADLIVLDGIATEDGDYIDIGAPMAGGQFVPVVIKEFIFAPSVDPAAVEA